MSPVKRRPMATGTPENPYPVSDCLHYKLVRLAGARPLTVKVTNRTATISGLAVVEVLK